jgi:hypothetical protein
VNTAASVVTVMVDVLTALPDGATVAGEKLALAPAGRPEALSVRTVLFTSVPFLTDTVYVNVEPETPVDGESAVTETRSGVASAEALRPKAPSMNRMR